MQTASIRTRRSSPYVESKKARLVQGDALKAGDVEKAWSVAFETGLIERDMVDCCVTQRRWRIPKILRVVEVLCALKCMGRFRALLRRCNALTCAKKKLFKRLEKNATTCIMIQLAQGSASVPTAQRNMSSSANNSIYRKSDSRQIASSPAAVLIVGA